MRPILLLPLLLAACAEPTAQTSMPDAPKDAPPGPSEPGEAGVVSAEIEVPVGTGVKVSGTIKYTGAVAGTYRIDVQYPGADGALKLARALTLPGAGAWEVELPKDLGPVVLNAFIDTDGKGPSPTEPSMNWYGVIVGTEPVTGIDLIPADGGAVVGTPPSGTASPPTAGGPADGTTPVAEPMPPGATPPAPGATPTAPDTTTPAPVPAAPTATPVAPGTATPAAMPTPP